MVEEPLKIGFVLDDSLDKPDGVQQYVLTLGEHLRGLGHDVHYLVGSTKRRDIAGVHSLSRNLHVRFNQNRMSMPLPAKRKVLRRLLETEQFDILHVQMPYSPFLAGRLIKLAPSRTAIVGTFHVAPHSGFVQFANTALRFLVEGSLRRFNEVMSVSTVAQDFAWKTYGIESSHVPNCALLNPFYEATPLVEYPAKGVPVILFLGRLVERKGCSQLLEAIKYLRHHRLTDTPYQVVICGDGPLRHELKAQTKRLGIGSIVTFTGQLTEAEKPRYLASADIAVFPSTGGESFCIVLIEAMAADRGPVLGGDNPGYAKLMSGRPQSLFNPFDAEQLAHKLAEYLDDAPLRRSVREWQRQYVARYDVEVVAENILTVYASALHKRRS